MQLLESAPLKPCDALGLRPKTISWLSTFNIKVMNVMSRGVALDGNNRWFWHIIHTWSLAVRLIIIRQTFDDIQNSGSMTGTSVPAGSARANSGRIPGKARASDGDNQITKETSVSCKEHGRL